MNKAIVFGERRRGIDIPSIIVVLLSIGIAILQSWKLPAIARWLPRSEWFYLCFLGVAVLLCVLLLFQLRTPAGFAFLAFGALCAVSFFTVFLFLRLDRQRLESTSKRVQAVQDYRIRPSAQSTSGSPAQFVPVGSLYQLSFSYPPAIYLNEDIEIELSSVYLSPAILEALKPIIEEPLVPEFGGLPDNFRRSLKVQEIDASVELVSHSFLIDPVGPVKFPLVGGSKLKFVGYPQQLGIRKILVRSNINPGFIEALKGVAHFDHNDLALSINVMPERTVFGLTGAQLQTIQIIASSIGFPALALAGLAFFRESRKEKRESKEKSSKKAVKR